MALPIKGEEGLLYIHDGALYRPVSCATTTNFSPTVSVIESITKCYKGVIMKQAGTFNYTLSADGEYIDTTSVGGDDTKASHDWLYTKLVAKQPVTWKYDTGVTGAVYYGTGIITDLPLDQNAGDELSTFSMTIAGIGEPTTTDPLAPSL